MAFTYNPALSSIRDQVRFLIGDTVSSDVQLQDAELDYLIGVYGNARSTALQAINGLIAKYSRYITQSMDGVSVSRGDLVDHYVKLRKSLQSSVVDNLVAPVAGGLVDAEGLPSEPFFKRTTPETNWPR